MAIASIVADDDRLEITIRNQQPVALADLTLSLLAVGQQFERFVEAELPADYPVRSELYVKDVRSGSIVVELFAHAIPLVPLFWADGALIEWANYAKEVLLWLTGKTENA